MGASKPERAHTVYSEWGPVGLKEATLCTALGASRPERGNTVNSDGASRPERGITVYSDGGQ